MKAGAGKSKGSAYERKVGEKLSLWISHGQQKDLICRTVGSGAQFTASKNAAGIAGDLRAQKHELCFKFFDKVVIECKHWRDLSFLSFMQGKGELFKALVKVRAESNHELKLWWLVAKQNNQPDLLITSQAGMVKGYASELSCFTLSNGIHAYFFDEFLSIVAPEKYIDGVA